MKYKSTKTGNTLVVKGQMFAYAGMTFSGLVDEAANALYDNPADSFNEFVGIPTALERGLIQPITPSDSDNNTADSGAPDLPDSTSRNQERA